MEKNENKEDVNIKALSSNLDVDPIVSFSDIISGKSTSLPAFSSLSGEQLEDMAPFTDFQPSVSLDMAVIQNNKTNKELTSSVPEGQKPDALGKHLKDRQADLFETKTTGFPTEVDAEELPSKPGGTTPLASNAVFKSRGGLDLRTTGNPYGYA